MTKTTETVTGNVEVRTKWGDAAALRTEVATELNIIRANDLYVLTFGEVRLPVDLGELPPIIMGEIRPVARLVIPEKSFVSILAALNRVAETPSDNG